MASYVQPVDDAGSRVTLDAVVSVETVWQRDAASTHFEGRAYPVTTRTDRVAEEWTVATEWWPASRTTAEAFISLLRNTAVSADSRLEVHLEPMNGAVVDAVVQATDIPQQLGTARTDVTVSFRRVEP